MARFTAHEVEVIRHMASFGHSALTISRRLNRSAEAIRKKCVALGIRLRPPKTTREVRFVFDEGHWPLLLGAAEERNMTVARLSRFTLEVISREDLWGAVLDGWATVQRPR